MKVAVSGPDTTMCHTLLAALHDARWDSVRIGHSIPNGSDRTSTEAVGQSAATLDGVDVVYLLDFYTADADRHTLDRLKWLLDAQRRFAIRRIVLVNPLSPAEPHITAERLLAQAQNCEWVVIRVPDLYDTKDPDTLSRLKGLMLDGAGAYHQPPQQMIHPLDLCAALVAVARSQPAAGRILEVVDPVTLPSDVLAAELQRLGRLFSSADTPDDRVRPEYPTLAVPHHVFETYQVLGIMPPRRAWIGLAECASAIVGDLRRAGRVADNAPRMPTVHHAIETGAKPLSGKICLVTGATGGIGRALAVILSRCGAHVIATGRNEAAGKALMDELASRPCCEPGSFHAADLLSMADIDDLLTAVSETDQQVDIVVNNAGAAFAERQLTVEGIEASFALNYLAPFCITTRLLERMPRDGHVINLNCDIHQSSGLDFGDLSCARNYDPLDAYARSRFASMMFTATLIRRLDGAGPKICAVNPGDTRTGLLQDRTLAKLPEVIALQRFRNQMNSPNRAACFVVAALLDPALSDRNAVHLREGAVTDMIAAASDPAAGAHLWKITEAMVERCRLARA